MFESGHTAALQPDISKLPFVGEALKTHSDEKTLVFGVFNSFFWHFSDGGDTLKKIKLKFACFC